MKWFRLYDDVLDDPKAQRLPPALFKHWINLLCLANKGEPRGALPSITDIAFRLRISEDEAVRTLDALSAAGLVDQDSGDSAPYPHNWSGRQMASDNVSDRVRKYRSNVAPVRDETLQKRSGNALDTDTDTDTDTEAEKKGDAQARPKRPRATAAPESLTVTDEMRAQAIGYGVPAERIDEQTDQFLDFHRSKGSTFKDWQAAWRTWMRRAPDYAPRLRATNPANGRASPQRATERTMQAFDEFDAKLDDLIRQQTGKPGAIETTGRQHA